MVKNLTLLMILLSVTCWHNVNAQTPNHYVFENKGGIYSELVNDTLVTPANFGTADIWVLPLAGETFNWFGKTYNINDSNIRVVFSNNGFMRVEDDSTFIVIDALFAHSDSIDANTQLSYIIEGTSGNKIIKLQWKNLALRAGSSGNYVNYQIWAYQKTGVFEAHYGPSSTSNASGLPTVGAPYIGIFYSLQNFTKMFEKIWVIGSPANYTLDSTRNANFTTVTGVPPEGTIFRYTPRTTSITDTEKVERVPIYPNPADSYITIRPENTVNKKMNIYLYDINGKLVKQDELAAGETQLILSTKELPGGMYKLETWINGDHTSKTISIKH